MCNEAIENWNTSLGYFNRYFDDYNSKDTGGVIYRGNRVISLCDGIIDVSVMVSPVETLKEHRDSLYEEEMERWEQLYPNVDIGG